MKLPQHILQKGGYNKYEYSVDKEKGGELDLRYIHLNPKCPVPLQREMPRGCCWWEVEGCREEDIGLGVEI